MTRKSSCLISCSHASPVGGCCALVGRQGGTKPGGRGMAGVPTTSALAASLKAGGRDVRERAGGCQPTDGGGVDVVRPRNIGLRLASSKALDGLLRRSSAGRRHHPPIVRASDPGSDFREYYSIDREAPERF